MRAGNEKQLIILEWPYCTQSNNSNILSILGHSKSIIYFSSPLDFHLHAFPSAPAQYKSIQPQFFGLLNLWFLRPFPIKLVIKRPFPASRSHQFLGSGGMRNNELIGVVLCIFIPSYNSLNILNFTFSHPF